MFAKAVKGSAESALWKEIRLGDKLNRAEGEGVFGQEKMRGAVGQIPRNVF